MPANGAAKLRLALVDNRLLSLKAGTLQNKIGHADTIRICTGPDAGFQAVCGARLA